MERDTAKNLSTMQAVNLSAHEFSKRTDYLAGKLGISLRSLCERAGISQPMFFGYRSGKHPITAKALKKIEALEQPSDVLHEPQTPYGLRPRPSVQLNPAFATPPPSPTREQVEAKLRAFLDAAEKLPGGMGYAYTLACIHFNPTTLEALKTEE